MMLPVQHASQLAARPPDRHWLVEQLWADEAVGILGGEPKCGKSFLALQMGVAVASGAPCLGRFAVSRPGRVLVFPAEDALHIVRHRLDALCSTADLELANIDLQVITAPRLRLDLDADRQALAETVAHHQPKLLVLDPFVRLHRVDENASQQVAPLLAFLRELQRQHNLAVLVVHHARKGAANCRAGQALRGSSEFHAWGDSNLYLRRKGETTALTVEHRAAPSIPAIALRLATCDSRVALEIIDGPDHASPAPPQSPQQRVENVLAEASTPLSIKELRQACRIRTSTLCHVVAVLADAGRITKTEAGYQIASE